MKLDELREVCLSMPGSREDMPFGDGALVFKVASKMFALISLDSFPITMNLKCDPDRALELREQYSSIAPGFHMNKKHWNTLTFDNNLPQALALELIKHSYDLVVTSLPLKERKAVSDELEKQ